MKKILFFSIYLLVSLQLVAQSVSITPDIATIENSFVLIEFDLQTGTYSGLDKSDHTILFKDAIFLLDRGLRIWKTPKLKIKAEEQIIVNGKKLRVWYIPQKGYAPTRFLDITVRKDLPYIIIDWGVKNDFEYEIRVKEAAVLYQGKLFENQKVINPKVLRGGAGAEKNFVEDTWEIEAVNSIMLTYNNSDANNIRKTIVAGGGNYEEFLREISTLVQMTYVLWLETSPDKTILHKRELIVKYQRKKG